MVDFFETNWRITSVNNNIDSPIQESFKLFLNIPCIENNIFEVPVFLIGKLLNITANRINNKKIIAILRMDNIGDTAVFSTSKAILNAFISSTYGFITKATTTKGKVYYGCRGLILDEEFQPLYMETAKLQRILSSNNRSVINNPIIRISPRVFDNCTGIIEKAIIKGIPLFTRNLINIYSNQFDERDFKADIQIEELGDWIVIPSTPNIHSCTNSCFNKVLQ